MNDSSIREFFKEIVKEAKSSDSRRILTFCSIPSHWFSRKGKYNYLDDTTIDEMELDCLKIKLAHFIADCFGQR